MQNTVLTLSDYRTDRNSLTAVPIVIPESSKFLISHEHPDSHFYKWLEKSGIYLNKQQIEVLDYQKGHLVVNALPGSGKTATITALINFLTLVKGVPEHNILTLCYSKKAATEMKKRLLRLNPNNCASVLTLHALSYKILNANGFNKHTMLTDDKIRCGILRSGQKLHNSAGSFQASELLSLNSYHLNTMTEIKNPDAKNAIDYYQSYKAEHKLLDYDDLLLETLNLLLVNTKLLQMMQNRFHHIIVDELQDINPLQYAILKLLCDNSRSRLNVFGDRQQAIFSFQGSSPLIMAQIVSDFGAKELTMNTSYRCPAELLGLAQKILGASGSVTPSMMAVKSGNKPILIRPSDKLHEAKYIAQKISKDVSSGKRAYSDFAVLFRSTTVATAIIDALMLKDIPFKTNQPVQTLYDAPINLFLISHLKLAIDRSSKTAMTNILSSLYLSRTRVQQFFNSLPDTKNVDLLRLLQQLPGLQDYQKELLQGRLNLLDQVLKKSPAGAINLMVRHAHIKKHLHLPNMSEAVNKEVVADMLEELAEDSKQFNSIQDYIYHINMIREKYRDRQRTTSEDVVSLLTIHGSKGLQFPCIFLIGANDGILPHQRVLEITTSFSANVLEKDQMNGSLDEERRLLYVAITRAKDELTISAPMNHNGFPSRLSRFLEPFAGHFVPCK